MPVSDWFTTTFSVYRQEYVASKSAKALQGTVDGHLQQASQEQIVQYAQSVRLTHSIWVAVGADVEVGDELQFSGRKWKVQAIQKNDTGNNQHLELLAQESE
jgi:SPP1 family predicted phage head-tail adaptor